MTKNEESSKLFVDFDAHDEVGAAQDDGDGTPYSGFNDRVTTLIINHLSRESPDPFFDSVHVTNEVYDKSEGWLVTIRYSDGGTFGRQSGLYEFLAVFPNAGDAYALAEEIRNDCKNSDTYSFTPKTKNIAYKKISCAWKGYFSRLEDVEIHRYEIK